jgi:hypothetical protein
MQIEKFGFAFMIHDNLIISKSNSKSINVYDISKKALVKQINNCGIAQFILNNHIYTTTIEGIKRVYEISLTDFSIKEIANGTNDAINILYPNIIIEVSNMPNYETKSAIYNLDSGPTKSLPADIHFGKAFFYKGHIYTDSKIKKDRIQSISIADFGLVWQADLDIFRNEIEVWSNDEKQILTYGDFKFYSSTVIISVGTPFEQRLACFSTLNGSLLWLSKEYNSTGVFHIKDGFAYSVYNNKVIKVNCITGEASMIDISKQSIEAGITMSYNFSMNENYIVGADFKNLKLAVLNTDTWQYDFVHQFVKGKDINKSVWQILVPQYYGGCVYVIDSDDTLHVLPFKV